ncbi:MAG: Uma2 family endonuclease [Cyanobacteria bacterium J06639_1]
MTLSPSQSATPNSQSARLRDEVAPKSLPTMYDLPADYPDDPGVPDEFHIWQPQLLSDTFHPPNWKRDRFLTAIDLNLYYDSEHLLWYKRPDWFVALDVPRLYDGSELRLSYVTWDEPNPPFVVVELLSPGTGKEDLGETRSRAGEPPTKWQVYEQILQVPYYVVFDRYTDRLWAYELKGDRYQPISLTEPKIWIPEIELGLGLWQGNVDGVERLWLRWYGADGEWIQTPTERQRSLAERERARAERERIRAERERIRAEQERAVAEQERAVAEQERAVAEQERTRAERQQARAEQESQRAERERARADQLAERLRALGIDPDAP